LKALTPAAAASTIAMNAATRASVVAASFMGVRLSV